MIPEMDKGETIFINSGVRLRVQYEIDLSFAPYGSEAAIGRVVE